MPKDRKDGWKGPAWVALAGAVLYGLSLLLSLAPALAESALGGGRSTLPTRMLSTLFGRVPFSVAEVMIATYAIWVGLQSVGALRSVRKGERRLRNAFRGGARRVVRDGGILVVAFFLLWGLNYSRRPLTERAEWPEWSEPGVDELTRLTEEAVVSVNTAYETLHGTRDFGAPTPMVSDPDELASAIREGSLLSLPYLPAGQTGGLAMPDTRVKRPWSTGLMARLGMSGVFVPFTAEPHVVRGLPAASAVQTFAHERAHSWGFANEAEASYAGYLANALAPHPLPRYAASLFAANQLLRALARLDRDRALSLRARFSPGVDRDMQAIADFWRPYEGLGQRLGSAVNDRYLRANRVAGGVDSYQRSSRLLVEFARQNGGLTPEPGLPLD